MTTGQPSPRSLPLLWLLSDARNDAGLEAALERLPRGSGFVFRHYHLAAEARAERFRALHDVARASGHTVVVSRPDGETPWGDGTYGRANDIRGGPGIHLATAHDADDLEAAERAGAHGVFLSPVFATRSHPGAATLGPVGFHLLAQRTALPVIALGGMNAVRAAEIGWPRWGAIDGLSQPCDTLPA